MLSCCFLLAVTLIQTTINGVVDVQQRFIYQTIFCGIQVGRHIQTTHTNARTRMNIVRETDRICTLHATAMGKCDFMYENRWHFVFGGRHHFPSEFHFHNCTHIRQKATKTESFAYHLILFSCLVLNTSLTVR